MGRTKLPPYPFGEAAKASYIPQKLPSSPEPPLRPPVQKLPPEFHGPTPISLLSLPDPLLLLISSHLDSTSLSSLTHAHRQLLKLLTPDKVPPPAPPLSHLPPLHHAALTASPTLLRLLSIPPTDVNTRASLFTGKTPLYFAILSGDPTTVRTLLDHGATINTPCELSYGKTALHLAASSGKAPLVRLLLKRGAAASTEDYKGRTALLWAARSAPYGQDLVDVFSALHAAGAGINVCDIEYGASVLHWAVVKGRRATVEWLLERGASVVAPTFGLRTPVGWAVELGDEAMVGVLKGWVYSGGRRGSDTRTGTGTGTGKTSIGGWIRRLRAAV